MRYVARLIKALLLGALVCSCTRTLATTTNQTVGNYSPLFVDTKAQTILVEYSLHSVQLDEIARTLTAIWHDNKLSAHDVAKLVISTNAMAQDIKRIAKNQKYIDASLSRINDALTILTAAGGAIVNNGAISTTGQSGGVTAGSIGTVNQTTTADKSIFSLQLRRDYAIGSDLRNELLESNLTDNQVKAVERELDTWFKSTSEWIADNMGGDTQARFRDTSNQMTFSYTANGGGILSGEPGRDQYLNVVATLLNNLDTIIKSGAYDPPPSQPVVAAH